MIVEHNIMNGSVTVIVTELGEVKLLSDSEFRDSVNRNEHNTWIATIGQETYKDIDTGTVF